MGNIILVIFGGAIALIAIIIAIKVMIWECRTEKEIEKMEDELNQRKQEEQELKETLKNLTPRQRRKLGRQIVDLLIEELESE